MVRFGGDTVGNAGGVIRRERSSNELLPIKNRRLGSEMDMSSVLAIKLDNLSNLRPLLSSGSGSGTVLTLGPRIQSFT